MTDLSNTLLAAQNTSSSRVVNQLLTEMDGVEERKGVFLMAASNRPDIVDPAVLRPGRLDKILYVGLPGESERAEILEALTKVSVLCILNCIQQLHVRDKYYTSTLSKPLRKCRTNRSSPPTFATANWPR